MNLSDPSVETIPGLLRQAGVAFGGKRFAESLGLYQKALELDPRHETARFGSASCHHALGDLERAAELFGSLTESHPDNVSYRYNHAHCLLLDFRYDEAAQILQRCIGESDDPHIAANLGLALPHTRDRRIDAARSFLESGAARLPADNEVQANLAYLRLLMGDFAGGWSLHERRVILQAAIASTAVPLWRGESLAGRTLLLWSEQGLGDSLQFVRYLPMIAQRLRADGGTRLLLQTQPSLRRLFATSFPSIGCPFSFVEQGAQPAPRFDAHCSLMSLPERMRTTLETIPNRVPYLRADPAEAGKWKGRLDSVPGLKVGLVWAGDSRKAHAPIFERSDRRRSTSLAALTPLLDVPGVSFVSLQKGEPANQVRAMIPRPNFLDFTGELNDFADTAALSVNLDLVITVDTSVCHLAGALGREVWLLNRWDTCWRWLLDRDDSPWYPTLRQYRQTIRGQWSDVIERIASDLRALALQRARA